VQVEISFLLPIFLIPEKIDFGLQQHSHQLYEFRNLFQVSVFDASDIVHCAAKGLMTADRKFLLEARMLISDEKLLEPVYLLNVKAI
jgi:hypothetical protein